MDKEIIFNMVEELSTELVSKITGIKTEYKLDEQEKKSFHELLSIQPELCRVIGDRKPKSEKLDVAT